MEIHASSMGWIALLLSAIAVIASGQIMPQTQNVLSDTIPINLRDCYNSSYVTTRENLLPMTTTNLIALLRKIEDATYNMNSRLLAPAVLLKYRYDGIERRPDVQTTQYVKPYARTGKEYYLYKLQMNKIIQPTPGTSTIPDNTLTFIERCTLHAMLSLSIDKYDRGDGNMPCDKLSKYSEWNARYPRDLAKMGDAEYLWPSYDTLYSGDYQQQGVNFGAGTFQTALSQCPMENGVVYDKYGSLAPGIVLAGVAAGLNYQTVPYSSYFVQPRHTGERRKVSSAADHYRNLFSINSWQQQSSGTRNGGTYGRPGSQGNGFNPQPGSQGYNPQGVNYDYGSYGQSNPSYGQGSQQNGGYGPGNQGGYQPISGNVPSSQGGYRPSAGSSGAGGYGNSGSSYGNSGTYGNSGNGYGASGGSYNPYQADLDGRYAATLAGTIALEGLLQGPEQSINIGSQGGWNSSSLPKYYFLQNWIAGNMLTDARIAGGVDGLYLASNIQTWKNSIGEIKLSQILDAYYSSRGVLSTNVKACNRKTNFNSFSTQLSQQSYAVAYMLNNDFPPGALLSDEGVQSFVDYTSRATPAYVASLPGTQCPYNSTAPFSRPYANITVVVDCNWSFRHVAGILNYLAENCDFWRYGSTLTIMNGKDGTILKESIQSPLDIPRDYNQTAMGGFDFPKVLAALKVRFQNNLQNEVTKQSAGGLPHIVIFVPMTTTMSDNEKSRAQDTINNFRFNIPDVRFLYVVTGSKEVWTPFAYDNKDVFVSPQGSDLAISLQPLIARIETIGRRIINPNCGRYFNGGSYNPVSLDAYLSPNEIHYYRVHQNYFFSDTSATITVTSKTYNGPTLIICQSRKNPLPMKNVTGSGDVNCQQLTGTNSYQLPKISGECSGDYYAASCDPYYFSVYNTPTGTVVNSGNACKDDQCRFPDQTKYTITHQGLTCYSSASVTYASIMLLAIIGILNSMWL